VGVKQTEAGRVVVVVDGDWRPCPCLVVVACVPRLVRGCYCYDAPGLAFSSGLGMAMEMEEDGRSCEEEGRGDCGLKLNRVEF
jgi:hypothetical protein